MIQTDSTPQFDVVPHYGIPPVLFGMVRAEVQQAMGSQPEQGSNEGVWFYYEANFAINFDGTGHVEYAELSLRPRALIAKFGDIDLIGTPAEEVVKRIGRDAVGHWLNDGHSHHFDDLDLGFWRPSLPEDYDAHDPEDNYRKGLYWLTAGIGNGEYFRTIDRQLLDLESDL